MTRKNIDFAAANWNQTINQNFIDLYAGGGFQDSGWVNCGTLINGATLYTGRNVDKIRRRVIDFKKFKLVQIRGTLTYKGPDIPWFTNVVTLPAGYPTADGNIVAKIMPATNSSVVRWELSENGTTVTLATSRLDNIPADTPLWIPLTFDYLAK